VGQEAGIVIYGTNIYIAYVERDIKSFEKTKLNAAPLKAESTTGHIADGQ